MQELMTKLKQELILRGSRSKTIDVYCACVGVFFIWYHGPISGLNKEIFYAFLIKLQEKNRTPKTVKLYKEALRFFCQYVLHVPFMSYVRLSK